MFGTSLAYCAGATASPATSNHRGIWVAIKDEKPSVGGISYPYKGRFGNAENDLILVKKPMRRNAKHLP